MYSFRVNLFSRADRNPFLRFPSCLPKPTHHPESPGKHYRSKNCNLPVWNKKSFCPQVTRALLLQTDLPAAGFFASRSAENGFCSSASLVPREHPRARERSSTQVLELLLWPGQRWDGTWKSWVVRQFGAVCSYLWSRLLCKSSIFKIR